MITNKYINKIIIGLLIVAIIFTGMITFFPNILDIKTKSSELEYATKLFDKNKIMSINIKADESDWKSMLENATKEEYIPCDVTINGTTFKSVGIRPKGNSSLSMVAGSDSDRFSFKFEFDHYIEGQTCFGLNKMVINNIQADATYMKEYLSYDLMSYIGVTTPLYSYTNVTVNGKDWGFYLAVESLEESYAQRNYGNDYGKLYKPDSMGMGGNGDKKGFGDMKAPPENFDKDKGNTTNKTSNSAGNSTNIAKQPPSTGTDSKNASNSPTNAGTDKENAVTKQTNNNKIDAKTNADKLKTNAKNETLSNNTAKENAVNQAKSNNKTSDTENNNKQNGFPGDMQGGFGGGMPGGFPGGDFGGGPGGTSGGGTDLKYTDDSISSYSNIFDYEVFKGTDADYNRVIKAIKNLNSGTELEKYINVDATLRYFAANTVLVNLDSYFGNLKHNYYLYEKDGQLTMLPWDYNLAFGGFQSGSASSAVNFPIDTPVSGVDISERPILSKLLEVDEYKDKYHKYLQKIVDGYFNNGTFENSITELNTLISKYVKNDATAFYDYDSYTKALPMIKEFGKLRAKSIQGQLDGTIPSTTDGQSSASDKLVDASSINLSTMGTQGGGGEGGPGGGMFPQGGAQQSGNGGMQPPDGTQQSDNGKMQPPNGAQQFGKMPDRDTAMKAMKIIQAANGEDLTQEQLAQLKELGLTDEQISSMKEMLNQRGQHGGFGGRPDRGGQAGGQQGDKTQHSSMGMGNRQGQESMFSGMNISVIIISVVCLLAGLLFVIKFKRVKN